MAFACTVLTPEQQILDEQVTQVIFPAHDGQVGILTDRAPMMTKLGIGELRLDLSSGQKRAFFIDGGIAQMKENRLTVLTNEAIAKDQIDVAAARAEFDEATASHPIDPRQLELRQHRLARARTLQSMGAK